MGSSLSKSHLPRNYWSEETGQVIEAQKKRRAAADLKVMSQAIARTIELCCSVKHPGLKQREKAVVHVGPELYRNFWHCLFGLKARGLSCPAIVTFNYDLVLERALLQTLVGTEYDNHKNLFPYSYVHLDHHYSLVPRQTSRFRLRTSTTTEGPILQMGSLLIYLTAIPRQRAR